MRWTSPKLIYSLLFYSISAFSLFSQDSTQVGVGSSDSVATGLKNMKGFHLGIFTGTLFANAYTTNLYDGYGFDVNGNRNDFANSFMYRRIVYDYGGMNGTTTDQIAAALNVSHNGWAFGSSDMPVNLHYNIALAVGLNTRYCFDNKTAVTLNVNAAKLTMNGDFTIATSTYSNSIQSPWVVNTFGINGTEERLNLQLGFQRIMGNNSLINFFAEGGLLISMAKYLSNMATINGLTIDLSAYYSQPAYNSFRAKGLTGIGTGAFAGAGFSLTPGKNWTIQLLYQPSLEKINIGEAPKYVLQNAAGLRAYYNF